MPPAALVGVLRPKVSQNGVKRSYGGWIARKCPVGETRRHDAAPQRREAGHAQAKLASCSFVGAPARLPAPPAPDLPAHLPLTRH